MNNDNEAKGVQSRNRGDLHFNGQPHGLQLQYVLGLQTVPLSAIHMNVSYDTGNGSNKKSKCSNDPHPPYIQDFLCSHLPYMVKHCKSLGFVMPLDKRITAELLASL